MKVGCFIGLTCIDYIYYIDEFPNENKKIKTNNYDQLIGGPAANAAITYSLLGGKSKLVTYIGNSPIGLYIKNELKSLYNIDVYDTCNDINMPSIATIFVNKNANRTVVSGQQIINKIEESQLDEYIIDADFYFSDCNISDISIQYLRKIKQKSVKIVLDLGSWKNHMDDFLSIADEIIASNDCLPPNGSNLFDYIDKFGKKYIAISNGENPISWKTDGKTGSIEIDKIDAIDSLGAGDILHGAFCYYRFKMHMNFTDSLIYASKIATKSVQFKGTRMWAQHLAN